MFRPSSIGGEPRFPSYDRLLRVRAARFSRCVIRHGGDVVKSFLRAFSVLSGIFLALTPAFAANNKVALSLESGKKILMRIVTVAGQGGDFSDPVAAVESIRDASEANPYLVQIEPGVYPLSRPLAMKPFVTIAGAGQEETLLTGAVSTFSYNESSALIIGADHATLRQITIENTGGGGVSITLYNKGVSPVLEGVTVKASGGRFNYGIYNEHPSSPVMTDVTTKAIGGSYHYGVYNASPP